jgi:hypothetical protein
LTTREQLAGIDLSNARWRKSSRSNNTGANCVEVASAPGIYAVRDSKNSAGPVLAFDAERFVGFLIATKVSR